MGIVVTNSIDDKGKAIEPIVEEIMFQNNTLNKGLVNFIDDIKANAYITEASASAQLQAYTSGVPTDLGALNSWDAEIRPDKMLTYQKFDPEKLRFTRYKNSMSPGAWNNFSTEFERVVIGGIYAKQISLRLEKEFWLGAKTATLATIAGLPPGVAQTSIGAEEQAMAAASLGGDGTTDGLLAKILYNDSNLAGTPAVGGRVKVVGTAITASNIKAEYDKIYDAIPSEVLENGEMPIIYAPYKHRQYITTFNNNVSNYKDAFGISGEDFSFNGIKIEFVPTPADVVLVGDKMNFHWCTDLVDDVNTLNMDKVEASSDQWFVKTVMTLTAHVSNQAFNVLYVG